MSTIADLETRVQDRLEENPAAFWSVSGEIRPLIVEAMNLATIITGEPEVRSTQIYTVPASTSFAPLPMPADALALLRVDGPNSLAVDKVYVQDLDRFTPGWEVATGPDPINWFPFGLTQFGIYPNLTADAQVVLSYIAFPVPKVRPFDGTEVIQFQDEYLEAFEDYAAVVCRFKEATAEFDESMGTLNRFLAKMEALSSFAYRKGSLRFTRAAGATSNINEVRVR